MYLYLDVIFAVTALFFLASSQLKKQSNRFIALLTGTLMWGVMIALIFTGDKVDIEGLTFGLVLMLCLIYQGYKFYQSTIRA